MTGILTKVAKKRAVMDYVLIMLGTTLMAFSINNFYAPNKLITGGVTGLAIIIMEVSKKFSVTIPIWLTNIVLNIPLFLFGIKTKGKQFLARTLFATLFLSVSIYLTEFIKPIETDMLLSSVFGGVISGIGLGLVFKSMATTGGTDLFASILQQFLRHYSVSKILFVIDSLVIALGFFVFGAVNALYAVIAVFIVSKVVDSIMEGLSFAKAAFIISERSGEISSRLLAELERGATGLKGKGMYTGKDKDVLLCVVSTKEIIKLKEIVEAIDINAFIIVADVREVLGEGFKTFA